MVIASRTGRRGLLTAAATACTTTGLALLAVAFTPQSGPPAPAPRETAAVPGTAGEPGAADEPGTAAQAGLSRSEPARITARRVGLSAAVTPVGLAGDGSIALPEDADHAGWYTGSVTPGERGNAVLVAHVDSTTGPAAFYELGALKKGDRVLVERRDGSTARFTVIGIAVHPKNGLPDRVYQPALHPRLTLITCTGWDPEARDYRDNLVVDASLITSVAR